MNKKYSLIAFFIGVTIASLQAQSSSIHAKILVGFEQWKTSAIKNGSYANAANCNMERVTKDGYKGPFTGIPEEISIHYADVNGDGKLDGLVTFHPKQCDGGNAMMNAQDRVLILSKGTGYTADAKYINNIEKQKDGWLSVTGASDGIIFGTYYNYTAEDGRCCPSIKKPFTIDFKTKKLEIDN